MDRFAALRAFVRVVEAKGFAAAAREIGQSRSAVNRLVIGLEETLGAQLLNRSTRKVSPTANGEAFYERARQILGDLEEAERAVREHHDEPVGPMRINAPMSFGIRHLSPAVADFMAEQRRVQIQLVLDDRFIDPVEEGYDIVVRISEPDEMTTMVDHRIVAMKRVLCAAPIYLEKAGTPTSPDDLNRHQCLHYGNLASGNLWRLTSPDGGLTSVDVEGALCSNNGEVLKDAAVRGLGVVLLPTFIVGPELQAGRLVTVLNDFAPPEMILCAIYPPARHLSAKVRIFTDFLYERFGERPYWDLVD